MDSLIRALACMAAACFFGILLHQPKSTLIFTALIGLLGYAVFTLMGCGLLAFFVSGLTIGILSEITARIAQRTSTLFLISSLIPIVPGLGLYRCMMALSKNDYPLALSIGGETLAGILAIALALTFTTVLFNSIRPADTQSYAHRGREHASTDYK
jgi:uncharacterized membrane protein YjjB (DUF3815 family)